MEGKELLVLEYVPAKGLPVETVLASGKAKSVGYLKSMGFLNGPSEDGDIASVLAGMGPDDLRAVAQCEKPYQPGRFRLLFGDSPVKYGGATPAQTKMYQL